MSKKIMDLRKKIESAFEDLAYLIFNHRIKTLLIMLLLIGGMASQITKLTFETSEESMLMDNDPIRVQFDEFRSQFGMDETVSIGITPREVFTVDFFKTLKAFQEDVEKEVPYIGVVTSLINARNTRGEAAQLIVEDLLEDWPSKRKVDFDQLQKTVMDNPAYLNNFISEDGKVTTMILEFDPFINKKSDKEVLDGFEKESTTQEAETTEDERHFLTGKERTEVVTALYKVIERYQTDDLKVSLAGTPVMFDVLKRTMMKDMKRNLILLNIVIFIVLFLFLRKISGVLLPLLVVILALVSTLGLMAISKSPFTTPMQILPSFLIAVGIADSVHVLSIFFKQFQNGKSKADAMAHAFGHSGLAILMTSVTTAAGLLSFTTAKLAPLVDVGVFSALGVMLAFTYTVILLPALVSIIPMKRKESSKTTNSKKHESSLDKILLWFSSFTTTHPKKIVVVCLLLTAVSIPLISQVRISHNQLDWFPDSMKIKQDIKMMDEKLKGTVTMEVIVDTKKENGLYDPELLNQIERVSREIENYSDEHIYVGKVFSINDLLKETNQALHENNRSFYTVPQTRELVAQEMFLFENSGSDDMASFIDSRFSLTRITIKTPYIDGVYYKTFISNIEKRFRDGVGEKAEIHITGRISLTSRIVPAVVESMLASYIIALVAISVMMIVLVGGFKIGLLSLAPNLLPIFLIIGLMGAADLPFDMVSILLGSIALGLIVDDTVHFIYNFRKYYILFGDSSKAIEAIFLETGRALLVTSIVLMSGFYVSIFGTMTAVNRFGFLIGTTIVLALLADFLLTPALLTLAMKKQDEKSKEIASTTIQEHSAHLSIIADEG